MKLLTIYRIILCCSLVLALHPYLSAQSRDSVSTYQGRWDAEGRADKMTDKISRELGLSKSQSKEIYAINLDIVRRIDTVKSSKTITQKERMLQYNSLNNERNQRFKTVLTATQYKKWTDWDLKKKEHLEAKMEKKRQKKEAQQQ
ncbi:hypothetical protein [Chitinophaga sp. Cy-1792]|uniref:hypothetical protein n=1 Tax=Chitinophaga sp. Cy-1792 TaxID=2608339 RepID=UPI0014242A56|nr:hypothetical protein [Chitinophaga sp. Cy-1792]NIG56900.1 hypothetical protein [Chitinophaga sp. Cy-1792]